jgi:hypothetical protein
MILVGSDIDPQHLVCVEAVGPNRIEPTGYLSSFQA